MALPEDDRREAAGFEGGVAGLGLSDLIQLNASSHFSGRVRVRYGERTGDIFFRDGEVVHAEQGGRIGEDAFCDVLEWPRGTFDVEPNVVTARRTIQKSCEHLLLDTHRILDERRSARRSPEPAPKPAKAGTVELVRAVPDVLCAVVLTRDGQRLGEGGYQEDALAGQASYLAMVSAEFGALFQAGEFRFATVKASKQHLMLYTSRGHNLGVSAAPKSDPEAVDAAIRNALTKGR
jgi:hypothetical protein